MNDTAGEWLEGQHEICASCDKSFWADTHNDRDEGWFCDECLEHPEDKLLIAEAIMKGREDKADG